MKPIRVMTIFGTRPEAIKMAPLVTELHRRAGIEACAVSPPSTGRCWTAVLDIFRFSRTMT